MDNLNFDIKSLLPYIIEAFTKVYGGEYYSIISKKIKSALIIPYFDVEGLSEYIGYIRVCKAREFVIRFLDEIGVDVSSYKKIDYTKRLDLDDDIEELLENYIGNIRGFFRDADYYAPLRAFNSNNKENPEKLLLNKLKIINYILGSGLEQITKENFNSFTETEEYLEVLKKINQLNMVYEKLLSEYNNWASQLLPYEEYIEYEKERKKEILQKKKKEMFEEVFSKLPSYVRENIVSKTFEEQQNIILGSNDIASLSMIEYFQTEKMEKLISYDDKLSYKEKMDKNHILLKQLEYLENLGVTLSNDDVFEIHSIEDGIKHLNFLNQESIKRYIPSEELIKYISSTRKRKYEEALREYYTTRKDFLDIIGMLGNKQNNFEAVYNGIKNKIVCILGNGATKNNDFISVMFYTIREGDGGRLSFNFMHECEHIIDQNHNGCGFESMDDLGDQKKCTKNPYDKSFRKYERFNETLNDMIIMEALEYLQSQGIYLIEPKEFTSTLLNISNRNTRLITKNLLKPLIQKFRKQVINAKVNAKPQELIKYIGEDNFENLVDAINKIDYLLRNDVTSKMSGFSKDPMVLEYFEQVERVNQIYISIDNFYANNFEILSTSNSENFEKHNKFG